MLPERERYDVLVAGGGPAGATAASTRGRRSGSSGWPPRSRPVTRPTARAPARASSPASTRRSIAVTSSRSGCTCNRPPRTSATKAGPSPSPQVPDQASSSPGRASRTGGGAAGGKAEEKVVDAEFTEVKDRKA